MSIPFDLAKKIILDIARGVTITEASETTGFSVEAIEKFFHEQIEYSYHEFEAAAGIVGATIAPYYDMVVPLELNHDLRSLICNEIDTYGNILKDVDVVNNSEGIWINDNQMNVAVFHTYDDANNYGVLHFGVNGFYPDGSGILHELDVYAQKRLTEDNYYQYVGDAENSLAATSDASIAAFKVIFKAIHNDHRV